MTPNYAIYNSLKLLILLPTLFLILLLLSIFKVFPEFLPTLGKGNMSLVVIMLYIILGIMMWVIVKIFGARAQNKRYEKRESQFNKVLQFFNKGVFYKKGVAFYSGKYGAHIWIDLKYSSKLRLAQSNGDLNSVPNVNVGQDISQSMIGNFVKPAANRFSKKPAQTNEPALLPQAQFQNNDRPSELMEDFFRSTKGWRDDNFLADPELLKKVQNILAEDDKKNDIEIMQNIKVSQLTEERKDKDTEFFVGEQVKKLKFGKPAHENQAQNQQTELKEPLLRDFAIQEGSMQDQDQDIERLNSANLDSPNEETGLNLEPPDSFPNENLFTSIHTGKMGSQQVQGEQQDSPESKAQRSDSDEFKTVIEFKPETLEPVEEPIQPKLKSELSYSTKSQTGHGTNGGKSVVEGQHAELMMLASELDSARSVVGRKLEPSANSPTKQIEHTATDMAVQNKEDPPVIEEEFEEEEFKSALEFVSVAGTNN